MTTKEELRKVISILLSVVMIFTLMFTNINVSYAKEGTELNKGDYIKFGSYNGEKILWRVIKDDDVNKRVMLISDRILTLKAFDASGGNGNNKWNVSNIRDWLNSEKEQMIDDDWSHEKPIYSYGDKNNYADEAGFLSNFLEEERNIVVKMNDNGLQSDVGNKVTLLTEDELSLLTESGYPDYKSKPTQKAVEKSEYKKSNLTDNDYWDYWTRTSYTWDMQVRYVSADGSIYDMMPYNGHYGVRPVLWLNISSMTLDDVNNGTESEAYTVTSCDNIDPTGTFSPSSSGFTNNDVIVTFDPDDEGSGVDYYKYSISLNGGNNYGSETTINGDVSHDIVLSDSGNIKIKVVVYDKAGNYSTLYSGIYKIDKDGPSNPYITYSPEGITNGNVTVSINYSSDSNVKQYKIDEGNWKTYNNTFTVSKNCKITARGQDAAGNYSDEVICNITNIDKTAPNDATFELSTTEVTNENVIVTVHYADDATVQEYKIGDSGSFISYSNPIEVNENCTIYVRGYDSVGNESNVTSISIINIDKEKPISPNITYSPEGVTNGNVMVNINYSSDSNVKQYKIDEGSWNIYNNTFTVNENCKITARGQDAAGNYSDEVICNISNIDKTVPNDATFELSTTEITNENVIVTVHYADDVITKEYKIGDSGSFLSYTNPIEVSENCIIYVRGYDSAGNESNITSISITNIDKEGPTNPVVSKESGTYKEEIEVEIVKGDDDTSNIYYTLDGTVPTKDSNLYINKIKIDGVHNEEVILKVVSYDNLNNKSSVVEKHYIFNKELSGLTNKDKKNFKYYVGMNKYGVIKVMLVSKTGKNLDFDISDILEIEGDKKGYFKEGIIYIDANGEFRKYK